ncbi:HTH-type transcriptional repressor BluR [Nymphon striatum]|nr:HTH-type transcriptional repressor BluR [Nymphon striatum]
MPADEFNPALFEQLISINYLGVVNGLDTILPYMKGMKTGEIYVTASLAGYRGLPKSAPYNASKAAVINLTESLHLELKQQGITLPKPTKAETVIAPVNANNCPVTLDFNLRKLAKSEEVNLCNAYKGKVVMIVNTASKCGFTGQFDGLEALYKKYKEKGLSYSLLPASEEGFYPIRTVSEVTGVNAITLRAWERRYGLFKPQRTPKGHRLYSQQDILRIQQVLQLLEKGVAIGRVSSALKNETKLEDLADMTRQSDANKTLDKSSDDSIQKDQLKKAPSEDQWEIYKEQLMSAVNTFDLEKLERLHHEIFSLYPLEITSRSLLRPVIAELRSQAEQLQSLSGSYHFYWQFLQQRIGGLFLKSTLQNRGKRILLLAYGDTKANVELMLFGLPLLTHGYRVVLLGSDIPFDAIPMTLSRAESDALILYAASSDSINKSSPSTDMIASIKTVADSLKIPVFIAGEHNEAEVKELEECNLVLLDDSAANHLKVIDQALSND